MVDTFIYCYIFCGKSERITNDDGMLKDVVTEYSSIYLQNRLIRASHFIAFYLFIYFPIVSLINLWTMGIDQFTSNAENKKNRKINEMEMMMEKLKKWKEQTEQ